ncbi:MAG: ABC transporter permease DevC [Planctomycetota bacterium]|nr:ABC transporter permease DevC [Planctomycetota bacterium]
MTSSVITSRVPLAWLNLIENKRRLATSLGGVAFAVILVFVEFGFMNAVYDSESNLTRLFNADLIMVSVHKPSNTPSRPFPRSRLIEARNFPGVQSAWPVYMNEFQSHWKNADDGLSYPVMTLAFNPDDPVFEIPEIRDQADLLKTGDVVLADAGSRDFYGRLETGRSAELNGRRVQIAGTFEVGPSFRSEGLVLMGDSTFFKLYPERGPQSASLVDFGLIRLEPGADLAATHRRLRAALGDIVSIYTKPGFFQSIRRFWGDTKAIGKVFSSGAAVGFLIGVMICYQILFSGITARLSQYATLRAMGYSPGFLLRVVLQEAVILAVLGFIPGVLISLQAYHVLEQMTGLPMDLTVGRAVPVLLLTIAMCCVAGITAARRAMQLDPAELF